MLDLSPEERRDAFPELFWDEIESWFTADVACCDNCYDEFLAKWPHAYSADGAEFQKSAYPLDLIYSGSRLSDMFDEAEYDAFVRELACPRCGEALEGNIWPYSFPFEVDPDFEDKIEELAALANRAPFLLLSHDFAQYTFDLLSALAPQVPKEIVEGSLFRARPGVFEQIISEVDAAPRSKVQEGRYNHAGHPTLYLASDAETCIAEMRRVQCQIAEITLSAEIKILDLNNPWKSHPDAADDLAAMTYSALMSAKQPDDGWNKPAYVFSRFVADCARESGIQAIKYPSTQITSDANYNLVIVDPGIRLTEFARLRRFHLFDGVELLS